jgi:spore coat polysaccharide biosynthesis protein SpsF
MTALVLQARLDSSRLPSKALLPVAGEPLLLRVMEALAQIEADERVLACPADCARAFLPLAERAAFRMVVGSKEDVLARYGAAIRETGADRVIRATGDNPFVFADAASFLAAEAAALDADYAAYASLPYGAGVEIVASEALLRAEREAALPFEREHVCPFLYAHPELFSLHRPLAPERWRGSALRVTVDTPDDYARAQRLYGRLAACGETSPCSGERIIAAYRAEFLGVPA